MTYEHPDGRRRTLLVSAAPLDDAGGAVEGSLAMVIDVTDARRLEDELRRAALHDTLTGLPNRALLLDRLQHALARETRSTAVLFVDLDQFKVVNDVRGHAAGDEMLVRVAARLRETVHPTDTVARFAGDEFLVVCEDVDEDSARLLAEGLLAAMEAPFRVAEGEVHLTASIGVALSPAASAGALLNQADTAMYAAKMAGRHRVRVFDAGLAARVGERYELGGDLRVALVEDRLELHHQPVIDLRTGRVVGTEALARWTHPVRGEVPPEPLRGHRRGGGPRAGPGPLGTASRRSRDARSLRATGAMAPDGYVAVNFSAHTLSDPGLDGWIAETVGDAGFAPQHVLVEVTESAIMADATTAVAVLSRLRDRGFLIAVDDFGTGHSSLAYLRNLPLTTLKIDRSFVAEIATDPSALAIASSIVELARAVGLTVVAEGVETVENARLLQDLGCEAAQGWLWSPAVSPDEARGSAPSPAPTTWPTRRRGAAGAERHRPCPAGAPRAPARWATADLPPPCCFARYIAASACRTSSSKAYGGDSGHPDADADRDVAPASRIGVLQAARIRAATDVAAGSSMSSQMITNSSPPWRATVSVARTAPASRPATSWRSSSPTCVAVGVVDRLEPVEVEEEDRGAGALRACLPGRGHLEAVEEEVAVGQPGQRVVEGPPAQRPRLAPGLGDVGDHDQRSRPAALPQVQRAAGDLEDPVPPSGCAWTTSWRRGPVVHRRSARAARPSWCRTAAPGGSRAGRQRRVGVPRGAVRRHHRDAPPRPSPPSPGAGRRRAAARPGCEPAR